MKKKSIWKSKVITAALTVLLAAALAAPSLAAVRLPAPEDVYWGGSDEDDDVENGTYAYWDEIEDAYQYEVYLYCDESKVKEIKTKKTKYNFSKFMVKEGEYTFRVRALSKKNDRKILDGYWSDYSDSTYMDEDRIQRIQSGGVIDNKNSGPGAVQENVSSGEDISSDTPASVQPAEGQWIEDTVGWWYRRTDGTFPADGWFQDPADGSWYFLDISGYMVTGWVDWAGQRYYCDEQGTPSGAMVTGDRVIDAISYTFDGSGALVP